ncbi:hypothetical protein IFM89_005374 [Coptis chinensis]|uniref:Peptidase metallopeptidase domain-containing protein n=1 Tax=Coptis chinensis TaxID=261450 RepID=A0A835HFH1_9MAGN|nr:hypothetical protein IFM89_005374 [Coptis chinensis]
MALKNSPILGLQSFLLLVVMFMLPSLLFTKPNGEHFSFLENLQGSHKGQKLEGVCKLKRYLEKFGYLQYNDHSTHANDEEFDDQLESAVKVYQLNYGLNETGTLDSRTMEMMLRPRCGVPDIINGTTRMRSGKMKRHQHGPLSFHIAPQFAFFSGRPKWPYTQANLTYRFRSSVEVIDLQTLRPVIAQAFAKWEFVIPFTFSEAQESQTHWNITIGFHKLDHGDRHAFDGPGGVLAHAFEPTVGWFHYDADENWSPNPNTNQIDLESIAVHEIGHVLGLQHSAIPEAVMYGLFSPGEQKRELHSDDILGIRTLYGLDR